MKLNPIARIFQNWYRTVLRDSKYRWLVVLGTFLYLVSPLDIVPDIFPIVGWIDDGLIATLFVSEVSQLMTEQLKGQRAKRTKFSTPVSAATATAESSQLGDVIDVAAVRIA